VLATLPPEVLEITTKFMTEPVCVLVKRDELTLEGIKQFFVAVERKKQSAVITSVGVLSCNARK